MRKALYLCVGAVFCAAGLAHAAPRSVRLGVVPEQSREKMSKSWEPLIRAIESNGGPHIVLDQADKDIDSFYKRYQAGAFDLAFINPLVYANTKPGLYEPIVRAHAKLQGILVTAKDAPYKTLSDLKGKRIAFPSPDSFAATVLIKKEFSDAGLDPGKDIVVSFLGSHDKVYAAVASGEADAGGGVMRTFTQLKPDVLNKIRILHTTLPYVTHPFVVSKRLSLDEASSLQRAMLAVSATPQGIELLRQVGMGELMKASDADYQSLRK